MDRIRKVEKNNTAGVGESMIFCTLFDSGYLDKGLVLYNSMMRTMKKFKLYIFAFDRKSYDVLKAMNLKNVIVIFIDNICDEEMWKVRSERTDAEFCWTCSPIVIEHVLVQYKEKWCTYVDADCFFFSNPAPVFREMLKQGKSVGIVEHRFKRDYDYQKNLKKFGKYCIQFNTFLNNKDGRMVLSNWKRQCLEWCYNRYEKGKFGDQAYLNSWMKEYDCVYEVPDEGVGVAPWNINNYALKRENKRFVIRRIDNNKKYNLILYHFQAIKYLSPHCVYLNIWRGKRRDHFYKLNTIYRSYLREIEKVRKELGRKYDVTFSGYAKKENENLIQTIIRKVKPDNNELSVYIENIRNVFFF